MATYNRYCMAPCRPLSPGIDGTYIKTPRNARQSFNHSDMYLSTNEYKPESVFYDEYIGMDTYNLTDRDKTYQGSMRNIRDLQRLLWDKTDALDLATIQLRHRDEEIKIQKNNRDRLFVITIELERQVRERERTIRLYDIENKHLNSKQQTLSDRQQRNHDNHLHECSTELQKYMYNNSAYKTPFRTDRHSYHWEQQRRLNEQIEFQSFYQNNYIQFGNNYTRVNERDLDTYAKEIDRLNFDLNQVEQIAQEHSGQYEAEITELNRNLDRQKCTIKEQEMQIKDIAHRYQLEVQDLKQDHALQMESLNSKCKQLEIQSEYLLTDNNELRRKEARNKYTKHRDKTYAYTQQETEDLKRQIKSLERENERLLQQIRNETQKLQDQKQSHEREIHRVKNELEQQTKLLKEARKNETGHCRKVDELKRQIQTLTKSDEKLLKEKIQRLNFEIENLKNASKGYSEVKTKNEKLEKLLDENQREKDKLLYQLRKEKQTIQDKHNEEITKLRKELTQTPITRYIRHENFEQQANAEVKTLESEIKRLTSEIDTLRRRLSETSDECDVNIARRQTAHEIEIDRLKKDMTKKLAEMKENYEHKEQILKREIQKHLEEVDNLKVDYDDLCRQKDALDKQIDNRRVTEGTATQLEALREELERTKIDLDDTKTRLSKLMGQKLTDNNPNITDLSDKNRPTKLAERYSELYDNQWTDAFEVVDTGDERATIGALRTVLDDAFEFCLHESSNQMDELKKHLVMDKNTACPSNVYKQLKDCRKAVSDLACENLYKVYLDRLKHSDKSYSPQVDRIESYIRECFELCWFMSVQDPPVVLSEIVQPGSSFNTDIYRAYTQSGKRVEYVVWPALLLCKGGSTLCKGVAQGGN